MSYKILKLSLFLLIVSCVTKPITKEIPKIESDIPFLNKGFALVYNDNLYKDNSISGKIEKRSLVIFQKNLKEDTVVKITNLNNSKNIIAKVGKNTKYPSFYNSVISKRISDELEIDLTEPYIEIKEVLESSSFIAKKAKTFEEEKKVSDKAPVDDILVKDIGNNSTLVNNNKKKKNKKKRNFNYIVKIGDFYFQKSANDMKSRIIKNTPITNISIDKLSKTKFRVYIGPYKSFDSLKKAYKNINQLNFENIEIIKK